MSGLKPICPKCGNENDISRLFCVKCGQKIDLSHVPAGTFSKRGQPVGRMVKNTVRWAIYLCIAVALGLLLWPVAPAGEVGTPADARDMEMKVTDLFLAVRAGTVVTGTVTEAQVNGYLASMLEQDPSSSASGGFRLGLRAINLRFTTDRFIVSILANWGPIRLSYQMTGAVAVDGGPLTIRIQGVRWGHLSLPGALAGRITARIQSVFSGMTREREVLDRLSSFQAGDKTVRLVTRGASG